MSYYSKSPAGALGVSQMMSQSKIIDEFGASAGDITS